MTQPPKCLLCAKPARAHTSNDPRDCPGYFESREQVTLKDVVDEYLKSLEEAEAEKT